MSIAISIEDQTVKENAINRCVCGNPFPYAFSNSWERVEREGRTFARCLIHKCGGVTEAFYHGHRQYWIWPQSNESIDAILSMWLTGFHPKKKPLSDMVSDKGSASMRL